MSPDRVTEQSLLTRRLLPDRQTEVMLSTVEQVRAYDLLLYNGLIPTSSFELAQAVSGEQDLTNPLKRTEALAQAGRVKVQLAKIFQQTPFTLRSIYLEEGRNRYENVVIGLRRELEEKPEKVLEPQKPAIAENLTLEQVFAKGLASLDQYLQTPREKYLHQHQSDAMVALREFLASGKSAGLFDLPPGSGKSRLAVEITRALGLKAVILSPYTTILQQTQDRFVEFAPDLSVSRYFSGAKEWTGTEVLNTTYASMLNLLKAGDQRVKDLQLLICDEVDTAQGEVTHTIFKQFPNALKIGLTATPFSGQFEGYKKRGLISGDEPWLGLFTDCIYHMPLEEGIERMILAPIRGYMLATDMEVGKVEIIAGEYNQEQIELYLNKEARDIMTIALVAGVNRLTSHQFTNDQIAKIDKIHSEIRGKRIVIIGRNKSHIRKLRAMLADLGLTAETIDESVPEEIRQKRFADHILGGTQVLLGIKAIGRGVDLPPTEVAILASPTKSGVKVKQDMGRALRLSPQTGKGQAYIIQLVDKFEPSQKPVLLSDILNPDFEVKGTQTGLEKDKDDLSKRQTVMIKIDNLGVDFTIKESQSEPKIKKEEDFHLSMDQLRHYSVEQINEILGRLISDIYQQTPDITIVNLYKKVSSFISGRIPDETYRKAISAANSDIEEIANIGKQVTMFLMMRSILNSAEYFLVEEEDQEEVIQATLVGAIDKLELDPSESFNYGTMVVNVTRRKMAQCLADRENIPLTWVLNGFIQATFDATGSTDLEDVNKLSAVEQLKVIEEISRQTGISNRELTNYFSTRQLSLDENNFDILDKDDPEEQAFQLIGRESIDRVIDSLSDREGFIIRRRYGFEDLDKGFLEGEESSLDQLAVYFSLSRQRISQIEAKAIRKLRHPLRKAALQGIPVSNLDLEAEDQLLLENRGYMILSPLLVLPDDMLVRSLFRKEVREVEKKGYFSMYSQSYKTKLQRIQAIKRKILEKLI